MLWSTTQLLFFPAECVTSPDRTSSESSECSRLAKEPTSAHPKPSEVKAKSNFEEALHLFVSLRVSVLWVSFSPLEIEDCLGWSNCPVWRFHSNRLLKNIERQVKLTTSPRSWLLLLLVHLHESADHVILVLHLLDWRNRLVRSNCLLRRCPTLKLWLEKWRRESDRQIEGLNFNHYPATGWSGRPFKTLWIFLHRSASLSGSSSYSQDQLRIRAPTWNQ